MLVEGGELRQMVVGLRSKADLDRMIDRTDSAAGAQA
jgi:hypothetical protein